MPGGDGTGPLGGQGGGAGRGFGRGGRGISPGPAGFCVCPNCKKKIPHRRGEPCTRRKCPDCGNFMVREK